MRMKEDAMKNGQTKPGYTLHGEKVWNRIGDRVELHLGNGNNVLCSEKVFRKVEPFLEAIPKS